jgi:BarA-like signal transduction histidine kinase
MASKVGTSVLRQRQAVYVERNIEARSCSHCCSGKAISVTYSECVSLPLGIQHAMRISHFILSSEACPSVQYFSTLSHKRHDLRKALLNTK